MIINQPNTLLTLREGGFVIDHLTTDLVEAGNRVRIARIEFALPFLQGAVADAARVALGTNGRHEDISDEMLFRGALIEEPIRSTAIAEDGTERHVLKTIFSDDELLHIGAAAVATMETARDFIAEPSQDDNAFDPTDFYVWQDYGVIIDTATKQSATAYSVEQALEHMQLAHGIAVAVRQHLYPEAG